jgi:hypothetical protein
VNPKVAAQAFANAFWGWLATGGVVWYFASWKWALIFGFLPAGSAIESIRATAKANKFEKQRREWEKGSGST